MTLHRIVAALGGDLHHGGRRANVPAPGHSAADRSVSLLLDGDRLVIHGFGSTGWRVVRDDLFDRGLIDAAFCPIGGPPVPGSAPAHRPDRLARIAAARRIWDGAAELVEGSLSHRHLVRRAVDITPADICSLRHHPAAPVSVFRPEGAVRPALAAWISDPTGGFTAIELTYLEASGRAARDLRVPRKTVGALPPGSAVRLSSPGRILLVGEGVMTVLSASARFGLPGWALLSARNLAAWIPPPDVRRVVIAADRGAVGERAAARLRRRLAVAGLSVRLALPEPAFGDWNEAAAAGAGGRREEGS